MLFPSATFKFGHVEQVVLNLTVSQGGRGGRFVFTGHTNLACPARATCDTFECPSFFTPKGDQHLIYCAEEECTESRDRDTCCNVDLPTACQATKSLLFPPGALTLSNLGDQGPEFGKEPVLWFHNVFPFSGLNQVKVDLRVSVMGSYETANSSWNGVHGSYGAINVADNTQVDLKFEFFYPANATSPKQRAKLRWPFFFSVLDFDKQFNDDGVESVAVSQFESFTMTDTSKIAVSQDAIDRTVFKAKKYGTEEDNPRSAFNLTRDQLDRSVTILYPSGMSSFVMNLKVTGGWEGLGRNFLFAGWTEAVCPRQALCMSFQCPAGMKPKNEMSSMLCHGSACYRFDETTCCEVEEAPMCRASHLMSPMPGAMVVNNLGGIGPDDRWAPNIISISDAFPFRELSHNKVDLVVTTNVYRMGKGCTNGNYQGFMKLCLAVGSSVHLNFTFVDRMTRQPAPQAQFALTLLDFAHDADGKATKTAEIHPARGFNASEDTRVGVTFNEDEHLVQFRSQATTPKEFPPSSPWFLSSLQRTRTVSATLADVSTFEVKLTVGQDSAADSNNFREFYLTGSSDLPCIRKHMCGAFMCPANLKLRFAAASIVCKGEECTAEECCMPDDKLECKLNETVQMLHLSYSPGERSISMNNVFPELGSVIDLKLDADASTPYAESDVKVARRGAALGITMKSRQCITWVGQLINRKTGELMKAPFPFWLTFINMVTDVDGSSAMRVSSHDMEQYHTIQATSLLNVQSDIDPKNFLASVPGHMPLLATLMALSDEDLHKAIAMKFTKPRFYIDTCVEDGNANQTFLIAGQSNLICPKHARCDSMECPVDYRLRDDADTAVCKGASCTEADEETCCVLTACDESQIMSFAESTVTASNLGGRGPDTNITDEVLRFQDVFPHKPEIVDLVVRSQGNYFPHNTSRNGLNGEFGMINVKAGTTGRFHFQFVKHETGEPHFFDNMFFTLADLDSQKVGGAEHFTVEPYAWRTVPSEADLFEGHVDSLPDSLPDYEAEEVGDEQDNARNPMALSRKQMKKAVSFLVESGHEFYVNFSVESGWAGRNMLFAGASNINCPVHELCTAMECPAGMGLKDYADGRVCASDRCDSTSEHDISRCCRDNPAGTEEETNVQYFAPSEGSSKAKSVEVVSWQIPKRGKNEPATVDRESWQLPLGRQARASVNETEDVLDDVGENLTSNVSDFTS